ncbi:MAG: DNA-3-methyladenine glycosylase [Verrucomicrobiae bacterium]|nr:DNA-3-methyladenine glycosylase [Verrucomicrobiae bacterium]
MVTKTESESPGAPLSRDFFERDPVVCARELIGKTLKWDGCAGIVVETEAYAEIGDEACHTFFRPSARTFVASHPAGTAYVYLNYGMYWLTNVLVKNPENGDRGFVLIRALEPVEGLATMRERRGREKPRDLCSGPGKLSMALGITGDHHGSCLVGAGSSAKARGFFHAPSIAVIADRRIGISRSQALPWRFLAEGNAHVSVPFGRVRPA